jgi:hypothetical protein
MPIYKVSDFYSPGNNKMNVSFRISDEKIKAWGDRLESKEFLAKILKTDRSPSAMMDLIIEEMDDAVEINGVNEMAGFMFITGINVRDLFKKIIALDKRGELEDYYENLNNEEN